MDPERRPAVHLFVSFDIEGSTRFKTHVKEGSKIWGPFFRTVFSAFPGIVQKCETDVYRNFLDGNPGYRERFEERPRLQLWKTLGDEFVFEKQLIGGYDAFLGTLAACRALREGASLLRKAASDRESHSKDGKTLFPSQLKATAWIAGFPIKNIYLSEPEREKSTEHGNPAAQGSSPIDSEKEISSRGKVDFVGPSIDLGFRLAKLATPARMPISAGLAWMIAEIQSQALPKGQPDIALDILNQRLPIYYLGREPLKGVDLDGEDYPVFCINTSNTKPMERDEVSLIAECDSNRIASFCKGLFQAPNSVIGQPFILNDDDGLFDFPAQESPEYEKYLAAYRSVSVPLNANSGENLGKLGSRSNVEDTSKFLRFIAEELERRNRKPPPVT